MEWYDDKILEFLDLYEREPVIWNPQSKHHKDRGQVYDAWKRIQNSLSVKYSVKEIKKKKEHLMSTYRKLAMKVKSSRRNGEFYKPEWFAYDKMASFLDTVYTPRKIKTAERLINELVYVEDDLQDNDAQDIKPQTGPRIQENCVPFTDIDTETPDPIESSSVNTAYQDEENNDTPAVNQDGPPAAKKKKIEQVVQIEKRMDEAYLFLKQVAAKPKIVKDKSYIFCELLCCKLRSLDNDICDSAMHEINNLMHHFKYSRKLQQNYYHPCYQQPVLHVLPAQTPSTSSTHEQGLKDNQNERIHERFAVISFPDEEDTLYIVASSWLVKTEASDFHICSWPTYKGDARIKLAVLENETPSSTWSKCNARLIKQCSTYESAEEILKTIEIVCTRRSEILFEKKCKQFQNEANSLSSRISFNSSSVSYNSSQSGPFICGVTANADESFHHNCSSTTSVESDRKNSLSTQTESFVGDASRLCEVQILNEASNESENCGNCITIQR